MVRRFYADVALDDLLGPMFDDVARLTGPSTRLLTAFCAVSLDLRATRATRSVSHCSCTRNGRRCPPTSSGGWRCSRTPSSRGGWGRTPHVALDLAGAVAWVHSLQLTGVAVTLHARQFVARPAEDRMTTEHLPTEPPGPSTATCCRT